jgi:hypothetical protein
MNKDEKKILNRDEALVKVLERLAKQIEYLELRQKEHEDTLAELFKAVESNEPRQNETNTSLAELRGILLRYHSEMETIVAVQDGMGKNLQSVSERQDALADRQSAELAEQERMGGDLSSLAARFGIQERAVGEHLVFSQTLEEAVSVKTAELNRRLSTLHANAEKHLDRTHAETQQRLTETQRRLDDSRLEFMRRLLALDTLETALLELLRRTEPPEPKPPVWPVRLFRKVSAFIRVKASLLKGMLRRKAVTSGERRAEKERQESKKR